jgi:3-phenylpropionate/trans-cinnamate dioxygenase ferredoxin reductase subunit
MESSKFVFLGGGMVAGYAAKEFVDLGGHSGELTIVSADTALPYERPPLSKSFLTGKDQEENVYISNAAFYRDHGINVLLNTTVSSVDFAAKRLVLTGAREFGYDKLVIATGAHPRKLDVPGADLDGLFYLRSLDDSRRIRDEAAAGTRAVVIGGGFIAMEAASSLAQRGVEVSMIVREDRIWKAFFTDEMSASFRRYYESHGVQFVFGAAIAGFQGTGTVKFVSLVNGQRIECDFAVAGIGVTPAVEMFNVLALRNGVLVNEFLETSAPGVYAAGDVANYKDILFEKQRRVEHWDNAVSQGQYLMRTLLGDRQPFVHVPYFFSDVFDLSYEFWGDTSSAARTVYRGDVNSTSFSAWWLDEANRLVAAFVMNRPDEERTNAPKWIESKQVLTM